MRAANSSSVMKLSLRHELADPERGDGPPEPPEPPPPGTPEPPELDTVGTSVRLGSARDGSTWRVCGEGPDVAVAVT